MIGAQLLKSASSEQNCKLISAMTLLFVSEVLDPLDSNAAIGFQGSQLDLLIFIGGVQLVTSLAQVIFAVRLVLTTTESNQIAVNALTQLLFEDEPCDDLAAGLAILQFDVNSRFTLLRHNHRLSKILPHGPENDQALEQADLADKHELGKHEIASRLLDDLKTTSCSTSQKDSLLEELLLALDCHSISENSSGDPGPRQVLKKTFVCHQSSSLCLKNSNPASTWQQERFEIAAYQICNERKKTLLFLKVRQLSQEACHQPGALGCKRPQAALEEAGSNREVTDSVLFDKTHGRSQQEASAAQSTNDICQTKKCTLGQGCEPVAAKSATTQLIETGKVQTADQHRKILRKQSSLFDISDARFSESPFLFTPKGKVDSEPDQFSDSPSFPIGPQRHERPAQQDLAANQAINNLKVTSLNYDPKSQQASLSGSPIGRNLEASDREDFSNQSLDLRSKDKLSDTNSLYQLLEDQKHKEKRERVRKMSFLTKEVRQKSEASINNRYLNKGFPLLGRLSNSASISIDDKVISRELISENQNSKPSKKASQGQLSDFYKKERCIQSIKENSFGQGSDLGRGRSNKSQEAGMGSKELNVSSEEGSRRKATPSNERGRKRSDSLPKSTSQHTQNNSLANRIKNNEIFVYKIVHDLRHPVEYLKTTLAKLCEELKQDFFQNDPRIKLSDGKVFQYAELKKFRQALNFLKKIDFDNLMLKLLEQSNSQQHVISQAASVGRQRELRQRGFNHLNKPAFSESQQIQLMSNNDVLQFRRNSEQVREEIQKVPVSAQENSRNRIEEGKRPVDFAVVEEEKKELPQEIAIPKSKADKEERNEMESEEELDSVGEEGDLAQLEQIASVKNPQKKDFVRPEVQELVELKCREGQSKPKEYQKYSLAFERLMRIDHREHQPPQRGNAKAEKSLKKVLDVIDALKEESAQLLGQSSEDLSQMQSPDQDNIQARQLLEQDQSQQPEPQPQLLPVVVESPRLNIPELKRPGMDSAKNGSQAPEEMKSSGFNSDEPSLGSGFSRDLRLRMSQNKSNASTKERRLKRSVELLLEEREMLVAMVNELLASTHKMQVQMENMSGQSSLMLTLFGDLMNQAQLQNNTFAMVNDYFDLMKLIKQSIAAMAHLASLKKVCLSGPILADPLDKYYFLQIFSDERRYGQLLLNFLSNSIKFTPAGGEVTVLIKVLAVDDLSGAPVSVEAPQLDSADSDQSAPNKWLPDSEVNQESQEPETKTLTVTYQMIFRDTGCGISPEAQEALFMNFGKLEENQDKNKAGVGLGLSICKEIILNQGGSVDIDSEVGKGTDFIITLRGRCILDVQRRRLAQKRLSQNGKASTEKSSVNQEQEKYCQDNEFLSRSFSDLSESQQDEDSVGSKDPNNLSVSYCFKPAELPKSAEPAQNLLQSAFLGGNEEKKQEETTRCLLANDNTFLLMSYAETLKRHFGSVETVENGLDAVKAVKKRPVDYYTVIILDIQMPIMDGVEACVTIREHFELFAAKNLLSSPLFAGGDRSSSMSASAHCRQAPFLYALTSETSQEQIRRMQLAGFKAIYGVLNQVVIREILENAKTAQ